MAQKNNNSIIKPAIILTVICLATALALALTNELTKGPIEDQIRLRAIQAKQQVLPDAETFEEKTFEPEEGDEGETFTYFEGLDGSGNVVGYVFSNSTPGYGGDVNVDVGVDEEGIITGVLPLELNETPGIGTKVADPVWLEQFVGLADSISAVSEPSGENEVSGISGSTISTGAFLNSVNLGLQQFGTATGKGGAADDPRMTAFPGAVAFTEEITAEGTEGSFSYVEAFNEAGEHLGYVFRNGTEGYHGDVIVLVGIDNEGTLVGNVPVDLQETAGLGSKVGDEPFTSQFIGNKGPFALGTDIDGISNATVSSEAYIDSVNKAVLQFEAVGGEVSGLEPIPAGEAPEKTPEQLAFPNAASLSEDKSAELEGETFTYKDALDADGNVLGYVFYPSEEGYHGAIEGVVGVDKSGAVTGAGVISHTETPGVGTRIETPEFLESFIGVTEANVGSVDTLSGATVSSEAFRDSVSNALKQFQVVEGGAA